MMHTEWSCHRFAVAALIVGMTFGTASSAPIDESTPVELTEPDRAEEATGQTPPATHREGIGQSLSELEDLDDIRHAKEAFAESDIERCRDHLRNAYAKHPNLSPPEMMLARLYLSTGRIAEGRKLLEEVSIADPDHPELYLLFGKLALLDGHVTDARLQFKQASEIDLPENWTAAQRSYFQREVVTGKTQIAEMRRDWDEAAELYQQQVKSHPQDAALRDRFAMALFRNGETKQAFEQFDIAYRQDAKLSRPEVSMAVMCVEGANFRESDEWFKKVLERSPDDARVHFQRSVALMYEDRAQEAERHADKASELGLKDDALGMHRGLIALQLGKAEQAEELFQQVVARSQSLDARISLALALVEQDDAAKRSQALKVIQSVAEDKPSYPMVKSVLGWVQFRNGQLNEAETSLRAAVEDLPTERTTLYFLSRVLMEQKREDEARQIAAQLQRNIDRTGILAYRPAARKWLDEILSEDE